MRQHSSPHPDALPHHPHIPHWPAHDGVASVYIYDSLNSGRTYVRSHVDAEIDGGDRPAIYSSAPRLPPHRQDTNKKRPKQKPVPTKKPRNNPDRNTNGPTQPGPKNPGANKPRSGTLNKTCTKQNRYQQKPAAKHNGTNKQHGTDNTLINMWRSST